ncbi:hypothetical protein G3R49_19275 [Shewanella sp. WXL01]|uniref:hypothetical protein n=1 Tax=Shewanella sp. WXL01 TaxID=2709721 RepID=UPI0014382B38|nr:hypothetical protein [Shewanella sp. WXL01]NKF52701.1 hypothetical protein [Shewanella sp. WXL01]
MTIISKWSGIASNPDHTKKFFGGGDSKPKGYNPWLGAGGADQDRRLGEAIRDMPDMGRFDPVNSDELIKAIREGGANRDALNEWLINSGSAPISAEDINKTAGGLYDPRIADSIADQTNRTIAENRGMIDQASSFTGNTGSRAGIASGIATGEAMNAGNMALLDYQRGLQRDAMGIVSGDRDRQLGIADRIGDGLDDAARRAEWIRDIERGDMDANRMAELLNTRAGQELLRSWLLQAGTGGSGISSEARG